MRIAPSKSLTFNDHDTGAVLFSAPMPCLAQIEACVRLEPAVAEDAAKEPAVARQRRMYDQCLVLLCPPVFDEYAPLAWVRAWRHRRRATRWLRRLQYPQMLDLYRKLMLAVQGVDFETLEDFERALDAQKKSTQGAPLNPATPSSNGSPN